MEKTKTILWVCLILLLVLASFLPVLKNNFTNWDDHVYVRDNSAIRSLAWPNLEKISTSFFLSHFQPLVIFSYALEYRFFGLDPFAYHLSNLILHLLNCLLVFWFIYLLGGNLPVAFLVAVFFGIHPLQVESVAWVSQRKTLLYVFFYLGALISYLYYLRRGLRIKYYFLALVFFLLALLSKSLALTLPLVLWLLDYNGNRKINRRLFYEKIPFFILAFLFGAIALWGGYLATVIYRETSYGPLTRLAGAASDIIFYLSKLIYPVKLSAVYPFPLAGQNLPYLFSLPAAILLFTGMVFSARYTKKIIFGAGFFFLTIFPAVRFMPLPESLVADHYVYLACLGVFYLLAQGVIWLWKSKLGRPAYVKGLILLMLAGLIILCSFSTRQRSRVWKDSLSLWNDVLENYPATAIAYNNRGEFFLGQKEFERAAADFRQAVKYKSASPYDPTYKFYYLNLGNALAASGSFRQAQEIFEQLINESEQYFNQPLAKRPEDKNKVLAAHRRNIEAGAYFNLANLKDLLKEPQAARALYLKAIELSPRQALAHEALGDLYVNLNNLEDAKQEFVKAIAVDAGYLPAYIKLAKIYKMLKQEEELSRLYQKAIAMRLDFFEAYYYAGNIYADAQMNRKAVLLYKQALRLNPGSKEACLALGSAYLSIRRNKQAIFWLLQALKLDPALAVAHNNLSLAYYYAGQYELALKQYDQARKFGYIPNPRLTQMLERYRK